MPASAHLFVIKNEKKPFWFKWPANYNAISLFNIWLRVTMIAYRKGLEIGL